MQAFLGTVWCMRSGAVVYPASSIAALQTPRACMEIRGSGPNRLRELNRSAFGCWFSRPRLVDRLPLPVLRPAHIPDGSPHIAALSGGGGSPVSLFFRHQRPDDARHSVCPRGGAFHRGLQHPLHRACCCAERRDDDAPPDGAPQTIRHSRPAERRGRGPVSEHQRRQSDLTINHAIRRLEGDSHPDIGQNCMRLSAAALQTRGLSSLEMGFSGSH